MNDRQKPEHLNAVTAKTASEVEDFHRKIDESFQKYVACYDFPVEWVLSYLKVYAMREGLDIADRLHRFRSRRKTGILEELKTMDHEV